MSRSTRIQLIVLAIVVAILATPFLIPLTIYRGRIEAAASAALSREVHIKGPLHLTVYPDLGLSLSDVTIANVTPFGLFVTLPFKKAKGEESLEGFIHVSEIAWEKVEDLTAEYSSGETFLLSKCGLFQKRVCFAFDAYMGNPSPAK